MDNRRNQTVNNNLKSRIKAAIIGFIVGDALGVPVEFTTREERKLRPVCGMQSGGTHEQIAGTWSDDTSMTLCMMKSIISKGIDYTDQMERFADWLWNATNTAHDEVFDVGGSTKMSIFNFVKGRSALECGEQSENCCGNGSLMRMLPIALYIIGKYKNTKLDEQAAMIIHSASKMTHAHPKCQMACGIYCDIVFHIFCGNNLSNSIKQGIEDALTYYQQQDNFVNVISDFEKLRNIDCLREEQIKSSGYVVHTLEASLWCLINTTTYSECVLNAVNLGDDTDTVAAIAGGLAGLWYGYDEIPGIWISTLAKNEEIQKLTDKFFEVCF